MLRKGQVVVLESTTWPGTTREVLQPILEQGSGLKAGADFHLAMSPERVDPGREDWTTKTTPKVLGGITPECTKHAADVYRRAIDTIVEVSTPEAAELTKLLENIFRSVNIALVNELAQLCDRMSIDVWEVMDAAATKPFGYMRFSPGPGLGGHCIPIDPFYLTWKAREFGFYTEFIELAGKVNEEMPYFCRSLVSQALNHAKEKAMKGAKILVLGVAYKPDIADMRESPALKLISLLHNAGADVAYTIRMSHRSRRTGCRCTRSPTSPPPTTASSSRPTITRSTTRNSSTTRASSSTCVTRPAPRAPRRTRSSSCDRRRSASATGGRTSRATSPSSARLTWLCDLDEELRATFAARYPGARVTDSLR